MPQMFPLLWLYLMILTSFSLLIMMSFLHFTFKTNPLKMESKISEKEHHWKW